MARALQGQYVQGSTPGVRPVAGNAGTGQASGSRRQVGGSAHDGVALAKSSVAMPWVPIRSEDREKFCIAKDDTCGAYHVKDSEYCKTHKAAAEKVGIVG